MMRRRAACARVRAATVLLPHYAQLMRARMTAVSAATFAAAALASSSSRAPIAPAPFAAAYLFVLLTQFGAHALGDAADLRSDTLNTHATPLTGGSRALLLPPPRRRQQQGPYPPQVAAAAAPHRARGVAETMLRPTDARRAGLALLAAAQIVLLVLNLFMRLPLRGGMVDGQRLAAAGSPWCTQALGVLIGIAAWAYGDAPLRLNARALGEIDAAVVTNILLPLFAHAATTASSPTPHPHVTRPPAAACWHYSHDTVAALSLLVLPPFLLKIAVFLVLNLADRRPDWATGKITIPVLLRDVRTAQLVAGLVAASYTSIALIGITGWTDTPLLCLPLLATAPYAWKHVVLVLFKKNVYRRDEALAPALLLSMTMVWIIALYHLIVRTLWHGGSVFSIEVLFVAWRLSFTVIDVLNGRRVRRETGRHAVSHENLLPPAGRAEKQAQDDGGEPSRGIASESDHPGSCIAQGASTHTLERNRSSARPATTSLSRGPCATRSQTSDTTNDCDVTIVGAGVSGLIAAAALLRLGRTVLLLERKASPSEADSGADLALWPGAISILRELGLSDDALFDRSCYPLHKVHLCNFDFDRVTSTVLKTIDMLHVTEGTGERFVLVPRFRLMAALRGLVPNTIVAYDANVLRVEEDDFHDFATVVYRKGVDALERRVSSRLVIGADGARSLLRSHVVAECGGDASVQFCGEVCYRGVLRLDEDPKVAERVKRLLPDNPSSNTMRIFYGAGLRSSFGYLCADGSLAYWWVKQLAETMPVQRGKLASCPWPEPLRSLHELTAEVDIYVHAIEDSAVLRKWSTVRVVLVGDSAHTVTPNMGQGACQGVEDSFVLAVNIARYWHEADGHLEAFYQYERARKPYASAVRAEARTQLRLGQLRHPVGVALRDALLKTLPSSVLERKLRRHNYDVDGHVKTFRACAAALHGI